MDNTPFSQQIQHLNKGCADDELTERLAEVVKAVRDTGKMGTITLQLKIKPLNGKDDDALTVEPIIKHTIPEIPQKASVLWSTGDGDLLRQDPDQQELDLTVVGSKDKEQLIDLEQQASGE